MAGSSSRSVLENEDGSDDWPHKPDSIWGQGSEDDTQRSWRGQWGQRMLGPWDQQGRETSPWAVWVTSPANTIVRHTPSSVNEDINSSIYINSSINTINSSINLNVTSAPLAADSGPVLSSLQIFCLILGPLLAVLVTFLVLRIWCGQYQNGMRCGRRDCKKHVLKPQSCDGVTWRQKGSALGQACYWACTCRWCAMEKWERDGESFNSFSEHQQTRSTSGNRSILDRVADHLTCLGPSDSSRLHNGSEPSGSTHVHSTPHSVSSYRQFRRPGPSYLNYSATTEASRIHHTMPSAIHSVHSDHSFWNTARDQPHPAAPQSAAAAESSGSFVDRVVSCVNRCAVSNALQPSTVQQRPAAQRREESNQSSSFFLNSDQYSEDSYQQQPAVPPSRHTARARWLAPEEAGNQNGGTGKPDGGTSNPDGGTGKPDLGLQHKVSGSREPRLDDPNQPPQLSRTSLQSCEEGKASSEENGPCHDSGREAEGVGGCLAGKQPMESLTQNLDLSSESESRASGVTDRPFRNVGVNRTYVVKHGHLSGTHAGPCNSLSNGNIRGASPYTQPAGRQALDNSSVLENENNLHCVEETVSVGFSAHGLPLDSDVDTMYDAVSEVLELYVHGQHVEKSAESKLTTVHQEQRICKTENTASTNEEEVITKQSVRLSVEKLDKSQKTDSMQQNGENVSYFADVSENSVEANYTSSLYRIREHDSSNTSEYSTSSREKSLAVTEDYVSSDSAGDDTATSWLLQDYESSIHFPYAGVCPPDTRKTKNNHSTDIECSPSDHSSTNSRSKYGIATKITTNKDSIRPPRGSHSLLNRTYTIGVSETAEDKKRGEDHGGQTSLGRFKITDTSIAASYHRRIFSNTNLPVHKNTQPVFTKNTTVPDSKKDPSQCRSVLIPITSSERQSGDLLYTTSSTSLGKGLHDTLAESSSITTSQGKGMQDILAKSSESTTSLGKELQDVTAKSSAPTTSQGKSFQKNIAESSSGHRSSVLSDQTTHSRRSRWARLSPGQTGFQCDRHPHLP